MKLKLPIVRRKHSNRIGYPVNFILDPDIKFCSLLHRRGTMTHVEMVPLAERPASACGQYASSGNIGLNNARMMSFDLRT